MTCAAPLAHAHHSKLSVNEDALVECVGVCFNCAQACITDADLHAPDGVSWLWLWSPSAMHGAMHAAIPAARSAARRRHVHPQCVVEAIEVVEEADDGRQLDNLPFVPVRAQLRPHLFVHAKR